VAACLNLQASAQAIIRRHEDVLYLSVALSERHAANTWRELDYRWSKAIGNTDDWALGHDRLFVAYTDHEELACEAVRGEALERLPGTPQARHPAPPPTAELRQPPVALWEVSDGTDDRRMRQLVAIAPLTGDAPTAVERWLWNETTARPPPLARYLAHTAKVRHQIRIYAGYSPRHHTVTIIDDGLRAQRQTARHDN
jgi:hypothetical protein